METDKRIWQKEGFAVTLIAALLFAALTFAPGLYEAAFVPETGNFKFLGSGLGLLLAVGLLAGRRWVWWIVLVALIGAVLLAGNNAFGGLFAAYRTAWLLYAVTAVLALGLLLSTPVRRYVFG